MKTLPLCVLAASVCCCSGADKDWDHEIILSLFRLSDRNVTPLTLTFQQEIRTETLELKDLSFADCESNRVRIIPGSPEPLTISVECASPLPCSMQDTVVASPMSTDAVSIVLASIDVGPSLKGSLEPQECAPDVSHLPDQKALGEACEEDRECAGGKCLKTQILDTKNLTFLNGYCTQECGVEANDCGDPDGECYEFSRSGSSTFHCLLKCTDTSDCRTQEGYTCQGKFCFPSQ